MTSYFLGYENTTDLIYSFNDDYAVNECCKLAKLFGYQFEAFDAYRLNYFMCLALVCRIKWAARWDEPWTLQNLIRGHYRI